MLNLPIPNSSLTVSSLCLGAAGFGTDVRGKDVDNLVATFLSAGGNFFDTAHVYACWVPGGSGASERELGAALRRAGVQDKVVVATKGGHPDIQNIYPRPADFLSEKTIANDICESQDRLGVESIDLYYLHRDDGITPVCEIIESLNERISSGSIRHIGASNWSVERIAEANDYAKVHDLQGFVISQIQGSLAIPNWKVENRDPTMRRIDSETLTYHENSGIPITCYTATAGGYFASNPHSHGQFDNSENRERLLRAATLATELGVTPTQVALAYLQCQRATTIPVFGTTRVEHLQEAIGSAKITLSKAHLEWLRDDVKIPAP